MKAIAGHQADIRQRPKRQVDAVISVCADSHQHLVKPLRLRTETLPLSLWLFDTGYWVSFAVPLLAVQFHEMVAALEEALGSGRGSGKDHA